MKDTIPLNLTTLLQNLHIPNNKNIQQAQRVFHGRGHAYKQLKHLSIDWFTPMLHITLFAPISRDDLSKLAKELSQRFIDCRCIQIQRRYRDDWQVETILGEPIKHLEIKEKKRLFHLTFKSGANTGLFLDMKHGRDWVAKHSKNKRVLNLFAYTCGFSVAAIAGGAEFVFNIDMKSNFLAIGRENHRLNKHDLSAIRFEKLNILKSFGRIKKHAPYDLIICDPPTFQKGSFDIAHDYSKLLKRLDTFLSPRGQAVLCINAPHIASLTGRDFLLQTVKNNAPNLMLMTELNPPDIFVDAQNKGTKVLIFNKQAI